MRAEQSIGILGIGASVPEKILTNADLEKIVDTSDEWIVTRTGIKTRHILEDDKATSDLAVAAAKQAIERAGVKKDEIDMICVCTVSPDTPCPSTACYVQDKLKMKDCIAFDLNAACTGFIYGLSVAKAMIISGMIKKALVIGVEVLTRFTDYEDRATCILFGDGAGAAVVGPTKKDKGILCQYMSASGSFSELIKIPAGGSAIPASEETVMKRLHFFQMTGNELFKHAVKLMADSLTVCLEELNMSLDEVDWLIPHQANTRIMTAVAKRLGIPVDRVYMNIDKYGNTSAASIPLALEEGVSNGSIKAGQIVALVAFGGGLTWGSLIMRW